MDTTQIKNNLCDPGRDTNRIETPATPMLPTEASAPAAPTATARLILPLKKKTIYREALRRKTQLKRKLIK